MTMYRDDNGDLHTWEQVEDKFIDMLDEIYDDYQMGELTWEPSRILEELDPIAYRCYLSDYSAEFEEVDGDELGEDDED